MSLLDAQIKQAESELAKLRKLAAIQSSDRRARDIMLAATLQALMSVEQDRNSGGAENARSKSAKVLTGSTAFVKLGTYRAIRGQIYDLLVKLDLIDAKTDKFKFEGR